MESKTWATVLRHTLSTMSRDDTEVEIRPIKWSKQRSDE